MLTCTYIDTHNQISVIFLQIFINTKTLLEQAVHEDVANLQLGLRLVAHEHTEMVLDTQTSSSEGPHIPQDTGSHQTSQLL
jgi:hypothetical protein